MIILLFKYIYQFIFSIFEKELSNLNKIISSKDNTIARLNKTISNLKKKIKVLNTDNETLNTHETSISPNYSPFEVDIAPLSVEVVKPKLNYLTLIQGKTFKISKCVKDKTLPLLKIRLYLILSKFVLSVLLLMSIIRAILKIKRNVSAVIRILI